MDLKNSSPWYTCDLSLHRVSAMSVHYFWRYKHFSERHFNFHFWRSDFTAIPTGNCEPGKLSITTGTLQHQDTTTPRHLDIWTMGHHDNWWAWGAHQLKPCCAFSTIVTNMLLTLWLLVLELPPGVWSGQSLDQCSDIFPTFYKLYENFSKGNG